MKERNRLCCTVALLAGLVWGSQASAALEDLTVMALGALDGRAVVKTADGKMQVLKLGDAVPDSKAVVKQVLTDRLVVEDVIDGKPPRRETVWLYKAKGGKSRIQRLDAQGPAKPVIVREAVRQVDLVGEGKK